ncbi:MAG: sucrase ferredoxin [Pseudomonadales bacterium]
MAERRYCSELNPGESLAGTADHVGAWLLLEYRPVWKAKALEQSALAPATRAWLDRSQAALRAAGLKPRVQFIRQPEVDSDRTRLFLAVAGRTLEYSGTGYGFLEDLDVGAEIRAPALGREVAQPHYFVCTNGQRDLCCARFGLPAYQALRERLGGRVWQATHLGGHRFAPNVLVLPQGALYGRVTVAAVEDFCAAVEGGALAFAHLRGRSWYPGAVQAAEAMSGRSDLHLLHVDGDEGDARVQFAGAQERISIRVARQAAPVRVLKSCGDAASGVVHPYVRVES